MSEETQEVQYDRKDLKVQALLERVSNLTAQYENQAADLRVEYTFLEQEYQKALTELEALRKNQESDNAPEKD